MQGFKRGVIILKHILLLHLSIATIVTNIIWYTIEVKVYLHASDKQLFKPKTKPIKN